MITLNIVHLGPGNIGKTFLKQLKSQKKFLENNYGVKLNVVGIAGSKGAVINHKGIDQKTLGKIIDVDKKLFTKKNVTEIKKLPKLLGSSLVCVDTSASDKTYSYLLDVLRNKGYVVTANKKPLTVDYDQYKKFQPFRQNFFYETTVGAGLPIISTIKEILESGDEVIEIDGCFSGTLSYLFTLLEKGSTFSGAVREAKAEGFTEPDPRDDLSGLDVARKTLILARLMGSKQNLKDIDIHSLYPPSLAKVNVDDFLKQISVADTKYAKDVKKEVKQQNVLRYVAHVSSQIKVGVQAVSKNSDIGSLSGTDNIVVIKTKRYNKNPMVIKGPGAGLEVTAAGVLGDVIKVIKKV